VVPELEANLTHPATEWWGSARVAVAETEIKLDLYSQTERQWRGSKGVTHNGEGARPPFTPT
jgi:hypothetical protein